MVYATKQQNKKEHKMAIVKQEFLLNGCSEQDFDTQFRAFGMPVFENVAVHSDFIDLIYNHVKPEKVAFVKNKFTNTTKEVYSLYGDGVLLARFRDGKLVKLSLPGVKKLNNNYFLSTSGVQYTKYINLPDLVRANNGCMSSAFELKFMYIPNLKTTGEEFGHNCDSLETFFGPKLRSFGDYSLTEARNLKVFYAPKLTKPGIRCLCNNTRMKSMSMNGIKELPCYFMYANTSLEPENIYAPDLEKVSSTCAEVFFEVMFANKVRKINR